MNGTNPVTEVDSKVRQKVAKLVENGLPKPVLSRDVLPILGIPRLIGPRPILRGEKALLVRQIVSLVMSQKRTADKLVLRGLCHRAILHDLLYITEVQFAALNSGAMPDLTVSNTQYRETDMKYYCWKCGNISEAVQLSLSERYLGMSGGSGRTQRVVVPFCPECGEKRPEGSGHVLIPFADWENIPYCTNSVLGVIIGGHVSKVYRFHDA